MFFVGAVAAAITAALLAATSVSAASARSKPTTRDFGSLQAANVKARGTLALADQRGCDRDDLRCLDRAVEAEAAAHTHAAAVERRVARTLTRGKCRAAMLNRAAGNSNHAANLRRAKAAWHARDYRTADRFYYARPAGGRLDRRFLNSCRSDRARTPTETALTQHSGGVRLSPLARELLARDHGPQRLVLSPEWSLKETTLGPLRTDVRKGWSPPAPISAHAQTARVRRGRPRRSPEARPRTSSWRSST
jgi:hypothetical protein